MANPNPKRQSDYRQVDPATVKLWTRDVLIWIAEAHPDGVTAPEVAEHFGIPKSDAAARMSRLKVWHCVKVLNRAKGVIPYTWQITPWGIKCANRWKKQKVRTRRRS